LLNIPRECGSDDVRIKIAFCGICGTDVHEHAAGPLFCTPKGEKNRVTGAGLPQTLGHEFSGTISELGKDVSGLEIGQRVCINPAMDDRHHQLDVCENCHNGKHNICFNSAFYGINAEGGGFAEEICVKPEAIVPLPDKVSLKLAALAEPLSVAAHMVRISGFKQGQDAVVLGAGPIGSALTFMLNDVGARKIIVSEISESRQEQARLAGASRVVNPTKDDVLEVVKQEMGRGSDIAFEACGLQVTLDTAIACVKPGGCIFNVAIHEKPVKINLNLLTLPEKRLMAGNAYTAEDYNKVIKILETKGQDVEKFITAVVPLEDAVTGGFLELMKNRSAHNKILVQMSDDLESG
jgi:(R,R)-butanediol dehydrogenase/meso-butanediol dehydrogenase/diacetyl reductase